MTTFTYSTELDFRGPWLLETEALEQLHKILDSAWLTYQETKLALIEQTVVAAAAQEARKRGRTVDDEWMREQRLLEMRRYSSDKRRVRVDLGGSKSITTETVSQAIAELAVTNELPAAMDISLQMKTIEASVSVGGSRIWRSDSLRIRVSPESNQEARELFGALRQWAKTYQPPIWQQVWPIEPFYHWMVWIFLVYIGFIFLPSSSDVGKAQLSAKARELLADGLQPGEQTEALEILLRLQTGTVPNITIGFPGWFKVFFWAGLLIALILTIRPKVVLGMGRGTDAIKRWRLWLRFVGVTVPGVIFTSFVWPFIETLIRAAF
jgi:hypothetical protein